MLRAKDVLIYFVSFLCTIVGPVHIAKSPMITSHVVQSHGHNWMAIAEQLAPDSKGLLRQLQGLLWVPQCICIEGNVDGPVKSIFA